MTEPQSDTPVVGTALGLVLELASCVSDRERIRRACARHLVLVTRRLIEESGDAGLQNDADLIVDVFCAIESAHGL